MTDELETLRRVLDARYSCRAFRPEPLAREQIAQIVEAAGRAPSWCNAQPWQFLVTEPPETDRLRKAFFEHARTASPAPDLDWPTGYPGVYGERRRVCGWQLYDAVGVTKGDRDGSARQTMENFRFFGAPHLALLHSPRALGPYGALDCGAALMAFTLAATALGVATIPQAAVAAHAPFLRDWFGLGEDRLILCAISFGHADPDHPANAFRTDRAPLNDILEIR